MTRLQNVAVVVTLLLAALTNAGALVPFALVAFLLPAVVGAALFASFLAAQGKSRVALVVGGVLILAWSELVNIWSGTADGPAARATFVAAAFTLVGVVVAHSESPALFLVAVAGSVCSALLFGAGGEVRSVAVAAVVSAVLTLGWLERSRRRWTARPRRGPALVVLALLVGAVAVGVILLQVQQDPRVPQALAAGQSYPNLKPPWKDPLGTFHIKKTTSPSRTRQTTRQTATPPQSRLPKTPPPPPPPPKHTHHPKTPPPTTPPKHAPSSNTWLYVLAAFLALLLLIAARLLFVRLAWRRLRRRLAAGSPAEQVTGAWAWLRIRLDAYRLPLAAALSPDLVAAGRGTGDLPEEAVDPVLALAAAATTAAFADGRSVAHEDVSAAWTAVGRAEASVRAFRGRWRRVVLALRGPALRVRPQ